MILAMRSDKRSGESYMPEIGENDYWHETRPHDDECQKDRVAARLAGADYPACAPGCRVGQPWPTLRLLPADRRNRYSGD